ncbi:HNH endonuclease, partial [Ilumatobacter sp.]|uniref:HNH endonuclease n=1 Tax=Ilumatobacter sp. TaxID=1967498 RepID=UPI003C4A37CB
GSDAVGTPQPEPAPQSSPDQNRVAYGTGPDGRWWLHADLDLDLGLLIESALDEARNAVFARENSGSGPDQVYRAVSDVDALVELAQRSLDTISEPARRNRYRVNLLLDTDGTVRTDHRDLLPDTIARLLTCDGSIDPVFVEDGLPISVGRTQRTIPDRTRRTVLRRDAHCCQIPGCGSTRGLEIHHITHWPDGGETNTSNLITLCARHHRMHHRHRLGITGNPDRPDTMRFTTARGNPIRASGANPHSPDGPPPPIRGTYEHPLGERLDGRWVTFIDPTIPRDLRHEHPDLDRPDLDRPDHDRPDLDHPDLDTG